MNSVQAQFERQGHKQFYVNTLCSHIASLPDTVHMWHKGVFTKQQLSLVESGNAEMFPLDSVQSGIFNHVMGCLYERDEFYSNGDVESFCSDDEGEEVCNVETCVDEGGLKSTDWSKCMLITGKPGMGKSRVLLSLIEKCIDEGCKVLVGAPTGILATYYRELFESDVTADTVHSAFQFPVSRDESPSVNWNISNYDLVVLDEISMVPEHIARHVIDTITEVTIRPVVLEGDNQQLQPIENVSKRVTEVKSMLSDKNLYCVVNHFNLATQYRCLDPEYDRFLNHIRYWPATQGLLDKIQEGKVVCCTGEPCDGDILKTVVDNSDSTVSTMSK